MVVVIGGDCGCYGSCCGLLVVVVVVVVVEVVVTVVLVVAEMLSFGCCGCGLCWLVFWLGCVFHNGVGVVVPLVFIILFSI